MRYQCICRCAELICNSSLKFMRMQTKIVLVASPALSETSTIQLHSLHILYKWFLPPVPTNLVEKWKAHTGKLIWLEGITEMVTNIKAKKLLDSLIYSACYLWKWLDHWLMFTSDENEYSCLLDFMLFNV